MKTIHGSALLLMDFRMASFGGAAGEAVRRQGFGNRGFNRARFAADVRCDDFGA
jgi:hypothetical protein